MKLHRRTHTSFSPYLNKALQSCVEKYYNDYLYSGNTTRDFWVSFVAMPHERKYDTKVAVVLVCLTSTRMLTNYHCQKNSRAPGQPHWATRDHQGHGHAHQYRPS